MSFAGAALVAAAWLVMWVTAFRLRPPLTWLGLQPRFVDYFLILWRAIGSAAAVLGIAWMLASDGVFRTLGLSHALPPDELVALTVLLASVCYAINLTATFFRRMVGVRPKQATVNVLPQSTGETLLFFLLVSPVSGVCEEIVFRGLFQWGLTVATGDPVSAVGTQAVLFGMLHTYQGAAGILRTFAVGLVLGAGVLASGSLVPAILAHVLINMASGLVPQTSSR